MCESKPEKEEHKVSKLSIKKMDLEYQTMFTMTSFKIEKRKI